jgi:hypothetical protein
MRSLFLLAVVFVFQNPADKATYTGPNALGPFHINRDVSIRSLFERLGQPTKTRGNYYCYEARSASAYLWFVQRAHHPSEMGGVLLSDFPNCTEMVTQVVSNDLPAWGTEDDIRLGSSVEEVVKAYGKPSREDRIEGTAYRWVIQGDYLVWENRYTNKARSKREDTVLVYASSRDLRTAEFGLRGGKVAWIFLSNSE